jgi:hypothetical protein
MMNLNIAILTLKKQNFINFVFNVNKIGIHISFFDNKDNFIENKKEFDFLIFDSVTFNRKDLDEFFKFYPKTKIIYLSHYFDLEELEYFIKNDINFFQKPLNEIIFLPYSL